MYDMQTILTDAVVFTFGCIGVVFAYVVMNLLTMILWWWCNGKTPAPEEDAFDVMMDSIDSPTRSQNICGWLWPIFIVPLCVDAVLLLILKYRLKKAINK